MSDQGQSIRYTRGVRASRVALSSALLDSGLKTQVALAARIAELEGLDSPPKDSVSRAFREKSVDPGTISRIARALGVEAHTLYLSGNQSAVDAEPEAVKDVPTGSLAAPEPRSPPSARWVTAIAVLVTMAAAWWGVSESRHDASQSINLSASPGGVLRAVLVTDSSAEFGDSEPDNAALFEAILAPLDSSVRVSLPSTAIVAASADAEALRKKLRADLALTRTHWRDGRYQASAVRFTTSEGAGVLAASIGLIEDESSAAVNLGRAAGESLMKLAKGVPPESIQPLSIDVFEPYVRGRSGLDEAVTNEAFAEALNRFREVVSGAPEWAPGYAGLCDATLFSSWVGNEQEALNNAKEFCEAARALDDSDPYVRSVWAHYLRRTGQSEKAIEYLTQSSRASSAGAYGDSAAATDSIEELGQLAEANFALYRQSGQASLLQRAIEHLITLTEREPDYWRWHSTLATYYYYAGELEKSVAAGRRALAIRPMPLVLVNLGMAQFCLGDIDAMLLSFTAVTELDPAGYLGYEYSGLAQFFRGNFEASVRLRQQALDRFGAAGEPEIHQMWGALGDSLRLAGRPSEAADAYLRAAEILERDFLSGTAPDADRAHRAYYAAYGTKLSNPAGEGVSALSTKARNRVALQLEDLADADLDQSTRTRVAQLWQLAGNPERARANARQAAAQCAGLAQHPELQI